MRAPSEFWILALLSLILLAVPLRTGDLAGYDDAQYAHMAKDMVRTGDWLTVRSNGGPAFENPPLFQWMQAALFAAFGFSDTLARLPSAACGLGTILLVYWLARRLTGDAFTALVAMFASVASLYFLKYAARAMTDVPFTFFFLCAMCAWTLAEDRPRWYLVTGIVIGIAQMTRSMMGLALPPIFIVHALVSGRRPPLRYAAAALALAFLPLTAWYTRIMYIYGDTFFRVHSTWLRNEAYGSLSPPWRRYTGAFEYLWMLSKSYWPWLPATIAGIVLVWRRRDRRLYLLLVWIAVVFALCAITRSRVLRYMLPAYPAFAILAAIGLAKCIPQRPLHAALRIGMGILAAAAIFITVFPRTRLEAAEIRPMAQVLTAATSPGERVVFYDAGQPRADETNQLEWYGDRYLFPLFDPPSLLEALRQPPAPVWVLDEDTYKMYFDSRIANQVLARSGHLLCIRLCGNSGCRQSRQNN